MSNLLRITNKIELLGIWDSIPSDSINSVDIEFEFAEDWKNLLCVAQFTQGEKTYNVVIENNRCVLPTELKIGNVMLSVFGSKTDGTPFRETSIPFCFEIYDAGFSSTAETPIPPTPDLYEQLIDKFSKDVVSSLNGKTGNVNIVADEGISVDDTEMGKIKIKSTANVTVDAEMSDTSENPVQNKVVKGYVDNLIDYRLINDITLTEDVASIVRTKDDLGQNLNLKHFVILFIGNFTMDGAHIIYCNSNYGREYYMYRSFNVVKQSTPLCLFVLSRRIQTTEKGYLNFNIFPKSLIKQADFNYIQGLIGSHTDIMADLQFRDNESGAPQYVKQWQLTIPTQDAQAGFKFKAGSRIRVYGIDADREAKE